MCVDLSHLNRYVKRERYQSLTPAEAIASISACQAKYFTVLDAMKGYHQCPLDQESQLFTTFIMPFGRFKHHMEFLPYLNIIIDICMKLSMAFLVAST